MDIKTEDDKNVKIYLTIEETLELISNLVKSLDTLKEGNEIK